MQTIELKFIKGHLFADLEGCDWVVDTGAPTSFGESSTIVIDERHFSIPGTYVGLNAMQLSGLLEHPTAGLLGVDVINEFDMLFDVAGGKLSVSVDELTLDGEMIDLGDLMGIPVIEARIADQNWRMFFDTGAKISYFQDESLTTFPLTGELNDFFPGFGQFQTNTHLVDFEIGASKYSFQCGSLPGLLGMTLSLAGSNGIVGNELIRNRTTGYFPRRKRMILG